ncbi:hypothetical protein [Lutibaculum baratangense]|uniref:Sulfotransferase domain-containing protein n=1 Tax=Lutibaculum baratangense AMV1 TaxID=631454 RepID=V4R152_9HYPH|nr:hypothetical protein [Lutibaculum baratangense]ESR25722.1 hypothetical protein N177_1555 [Lutibaculum baratangense AMV1]
MNELEVQILGMSRSGNHAISNWIYQQSENPKVVLNCAEGKTNPFLTCRPLGSGRPWRAEPGIDLEAEGQGRLTRKAALIHTYEDSWFGHAFSTQLNQEHDRWVGPSRRRVRLLVLRDPFNLFASRIRMGCDLSSHVAQRMWKQHARAALGGGSARPAGLRVVLYNRWAVDRTYRRDLAHALGIAFTDQGANEVPDCAGGSSFDGTAFDGRPEHMALAGRWRRYADAPDFWRIFDEETLAMSERLFGEASFAGATEVVEALAFARRSPEPPEGTALAA